MIWNLRRVSFIKKCLILLTEEIQTSFERLMKYMKRNIDQADQKCPEENLSKVARHNNHLHPEIEVGSEEHYRGKGFV